MEKKESKQKRYYKKDEIVWIVELKKEGKVENLDKDNLTMTVTYRDGSEVKKYTNKIWLFDKLKYKAREFNNQKYSKRPTYFAPVNGGIIPTKTEENGGRDCYARLEPVIRNGKKVYELHIPHLTMAKIPLGFASYLNLGDVLSLKHERSSIGSTGLISVSGLIDSTYQGEVILQVVPLIADIIISSEVDEKYYDEALNTYFIPYHKAIAQAVLLRQSDAKDEHISYEELLKKPSTRGVNGWGSTDK